MSDGLNKYEPVLTIGTIAKMINVAVPTLRMYEKAGLVLPHKTETGRRMYSAYDLDRLQCVRNLITKEGLNLAGIRKLISLIPCWEFKGGFDDDCRNCQAYYETVGPCWSLEKVGDKCVTTDCRACEVYLMEFSCNKLKQILFNHSHNNEEKNNNAK